MRTEQGARMIQQGARMVVMDNATTNAGELLKNLQLTYNRAHQAAVSTSSWPCGGRS